MDYSLREVEFFLKIKSLFWKHEIKSLIYLIFLPKLSKQMNKVNVQCSLTVLLVDETKMQTVKMAPVKNGATQKKCNKIEN